jgi:RNA polymerase-binding protein DksA
MTQNQYYTVEQLEVFKNLLLEKRQEALEELEYCKKELEEGLSHASGDNSTYSFHMADQGTDAQEQEKTFMFASRQGKFLQTADAALERIEKGRYGICSSCSGKIDEGRLRIVLTAKLCINCKTPEE